MKWHILVGGLIVVWISDGARPCLAAAEPVAPVILTPIFSTRDAVEVTPVDHGRPGQNARVNWVLAGPGVLYLFPAKLRGDTVEPTPLLAQLDLTNGKLREIYPDDNIQLRQKAGPDLSDLPKTPWPWGAPLCGAVLPDGRLVLGLDAGGKVNSGDRRTTKRQRGTLPGEKPVVVYFDPQANVFEEIAIAPVPPVGIATRGADIWLLAGDGTLSVFDPTTGNFDSVGHIPGAKECQGLVGDDQQNLYTVAGAQVVAVRVENRTVKATVVLANLDSAQLLASVPVPRCEVIINKAGHFSRQAFALRAGQATPIATLSPWPGRGYELDTDFNSEPLAVAARQPGQDWKRFPVVFTRAAWDNIKTMLGSPDGKSLYGAGWPTAWIWRFDPATSRFQLFGSHYEIYYLRNWNDEIWASGYFGIKLLRWRPAEPWTFDYERHYNQKKYPGNSSPWGDKDVSNPRLVCKFRFLKQLEVRRPAGMVLTDDGCAWIGGHTPAVEYFNSRFSGAVNWYDPATETIGQIREPFLHHTVRDVCRAGPAHVAAVAAQYISPFEPVPPNFSPGKFVVMDTHNRSVVLDSSPLDAELAYAAEGEPGRVVVAGKPGKYAGDGIAGAFFIFDVAKMQVTQVIRLPVKVVWTEYDNSTRFARGPDHKIYFYGRDASGVALCRVDSVTGVVEPVLRGHNITDVATYNNPGAAFTFCGERAYFGAQHLVSVPVQTVTGGTP